MSSQIFSCLRKGAWRHWCVLYFSILIAVPKKQRKAFILREAIFKSNAFEQTIDATAIHSMSDYQENYRGNLYCCTPGCPAKVKWASYNGKTPFFATWPYSQHASSCPYAFERDPSKTAERSTEDFNTRVSLKHKQNALYKANKKLMQADGKLPPDPPRNAQKNRTHAGATKREVRRVPSTDPNALPEQRGERSMRLAQKHCQDLSPNNHGKYVTVFGHITGAELGEQSVRLRFDTGDASPVELHFYTPFQISSEQRYGWIRQIARLIQKGKLDSLAVSCMGECTYSAGAYTVQVMDSDSISIDGKSLPAFYGSLDNLLPPLKTPAKRSQTSRSLSL